MWLFKNKYFADGSLSRYKTRLVANGTMNNKVLIMRRHLVCWLNRPLLGWFSVSLLLNIGRFINSMSRILFSMKKYATEILEHDGMRNYHLCRTPVDTKSNLGDDGTSVSDPTLDRSLAGALHYLTFTRPDLSYADPTLCSTLSIMDFGCILPRHLLWLPIKMLIGRLPNYSSFCFSVEAGYRGVANVVAETSWLRNLLRELHSSPHSATIVYCDNVSKGQVRLLHVLSRYQYADIFTKGLLSTLFDEFQTSLSVFRSPAPTARAISGLAATNYQEAIQATEDIDSPTVGFAKTADYKGGLANQVNAIIKQNNTLLYLASKQSQKLVELEEKFDKLKQKVYTIIEKEIQPADLEDSISSLAKRIDHFSISASLGIRSEKTSILRP
nr:ribonuclease H-like domain-containing protein [Tanacetum cinerariifolium]